ncbi:DEAD/DEAH box helicase [Streptomyces nigrescens]|uniref:DEAD/DEAH box helicase n=1 Tax=Streptomyces nigrescens TaxID=1920 RepID=UPI0037F5A2CD
MSGAEVPPWLASVARQGVLDASAAREVRERLARDGLTHADVRFLLCSELTGELVQPVRVEVIALLARHPYWATSVLNMNTAMLRSQGVRTQMLRVGESPHEVFSARSSVALAGQEYVGRWSRGRTKKMAEQRSHVSLLAAIADCPQPFAEESSDEGRASVPGEGQPLWTTPRTRSPITVLEEMGRQGEIEGLEFTSSAGPPFTVRVVCTRHGQRVSSRGQGVKLQLARGEAAAGLLQELGRVWSDGQADGATQDPAPQEDLPRREGSSHEQPSRAAWSVLGSQAAADSGSQRDGAPTTHVPGPRSAGSDGAEDARAPHPPSGGNEAKEAEPRSGPERLARQREVLQETADLLPAQPSLEYEAVWRAVARGAEVVFDSTDPGGGSCFLCCVLPSGSTSAQDGPSGALVTRELLLSGGEVVVTACGRVDVVDVLHVLADGRTEVRQGWSASARLWSQVARLVLELVREGRLRPDVAAGLSLGVRRPLWRPILGPEHVQFVNEAARELARLPRVLGDGEGGSTRRLPLDAGACVRSAVDLLVERFVPAPGHRFLLGHVPFAAQIQLPGPALALQEWADDLADELGNADEQGVVGEAVLPSGPDVQSAEAMPMLVLCIGEPPVPGHGAGEGDVPQGQLRAELRLQRTRTADVSSGDRGSVGADEVWEGHPDFSTPGLPDRVGRTLRRAGREFAPLLQLGLQLRPHKLLLSLKDAALLRGELAVRLRQAGVEIEWDKEWAADLRIEAVVGTGSSPVDDGGPIGLGEALDRRWQLTLDGEPLSARELALLTETAMPCVRLRNRWVLIDDSTREQASRPLPSVPARRALLEALYGQITLDGVTYACRPADGLRELLGHLQGTIPQAPLTAPPGLVGLRLHPYQEEALRWLVQVTTVGFGPMLGHEMGLGKTVMAIAFHLWWRANHTSRPTLVLCPKSLITTWKRALSAHAPGVPITVYDGPRRSLAKVGEDHVVLTTYPILRQDFAHLGARTWGLVIADEAQKLKNPATRTARLAQSLKSTTRLALTGTPMENCPEELWALLDWANPQLFGSCSDFTRRYVRPTSSGPPQQAREAVERLHQLLAPFLLRRLKSDPALGLNLPPKRKIIHYVPLSSEQIGLCEALSRDTFRQIHTCPDQGRRGLLTLALIKDLKQICISPALYAKDPSETAAADPVEAATRAPKLALLHNILQPVRDAGEAALVFTTYRESISLIIHYLKARGFRALQYHGGMSAAQRTRAVDDFAAGDATALVLTPQSGGIGLDLTRANHVLHIDRLWNPAHEAQANDRAHRPGQTRPVTVHHLIAKGSIEDRIRALLERKQELTDLFLPDGSLDLSRVTADELIALCGAPL